MRCNRKVYIFFFLTGEHYAPRRKEKEEEEKEEVYTIATYTPRNLWVLRC